MKFSQCIAIIAAIFLIAVSGLATADVLPNPVPENQLFTVNSVIDVVGPASESVSTEWRVGDVGLDRLAAARGVNRNSPNDPATGVRSGRIALATYDDLIMSNGGQFAEVKSFAMDTRAKTAGLYNIDTQKVLTYTSQNGSHLLGEESYVLDIVGNWSKGADGIVCVFARPARDLIPAFCNKVTASSKLRSVTTAQIQTTGALTAVATTSNVPAALNYQISVGPDANSASGFADGIISTTFSVSIMEGRTDGRILNATTGAVVGDAGPFTPNEAFVLENYNQLASTLTYRDTATVAGGITTFVKDFDYQSGIACSSCK